jgi:hypothetical protein
VFRWPFGDRSISTRQNTTECRDRRSSYSYRVHDAIGRCGRYARERGAVPRRLMSDVCRSGFVVTAAYRGATSTYVLSLAGIRYSERSATVGSTFVARSAGMYEARSDEASYSEPSSTRSSSADS